MRLPPSRGRLLLPPRVVANHLELAGPQLEQGPGRQPARRPGPACSARDRRVVGNLARALLGILHRADACSRLAFDAASAEPLAERAGLLDGRLLRLLQDLAVFGELVGRLGAGLAPDQLPGAVDDLLLKLGELGRPRGRCRPLLLLLVLGRSARRAVRPGGRSPRSGGPRRRTCRPTVRRGWPSGPMSSAQKK